MKTLLSFSLSLFIFSHSIFISISLSFRFLEASKAAGLRKVPVHPESRGEGHLHLLRQGPDHRLRSGGRHERDDGATARVPQQGGGPPARQDQVRGQAQLVQWELGQGPDTRVLHRNKTERYVFFGLYRIKY